MLIRHYTSEELVKAPHILLTAVYVTCHTRQCFTEKAWRHLFLCQLFCMWPFFYK